MSDDSQTKLEISISELSQHVSIEHKPLPTPSSKRKGCLRGCKEKCLRICSINNQSGSPCEVKAPKKLKFNYKEKAKPVETSNGHHGLSYINLLQLKLANLDKNQKEIQQENQRLKEKVKFLNFMLEFTKKAGEFKPFN